jgi:NTE family protein
MGIAMQRQKIFVSFQGGGAKGIVHIGGLRAIEVSALDIVGLAGTSAGSIVAALVAAGYKSDDLFSEDGSRDLLQTVADGTYKSPKDLFSRLGWWAIRGIGVVARVPSLIRTIGLVALIASSIAWAVMSPWELSRVERIAVVAAFLSFIGLLLWCFCGLSSLHHIEAVVDEALRKGPLTKGHSSSEPLTFASFKRAGARPLKVVATNLTTGTHEMFSAQTTPTIRVAEAVAASIAIPFVFRRKVIDMKRPASRPWRMPPPQPESFVDGGLLSNLPIWTFAEERTLASECLTLGFQLTTRGRAPVKPDPSMARLLDTIINGTVKIHSLGVVNLMLVPLPTSLTMLSFNKSRNRYIKDVRVACRRALAVLDEQVNLRLAVSGLLSELAEQLLDIWEGGANGLSPVVSLYLQRRDEHQVVRLISRSGEIGAWNGSVLPLDVSIYDLSWRLNLTAFLAPDKPWMGQVAGSDWFVVTPLNGPGQQDRALLLTIQVPGLSRETFASTLESKREVEKLIRALVKEFDEVNLLGQLARKAQLWN